MSKIATHKTELVRAAIPAPAKHISDPFAAIMARRGDCISVALAGSSITERGMLLRVSVTGLYIHYLSLDLQERTILHQSARGVIEQPVRDFAVVGLGKASRQLVRPTATAQEGLGRLLERPSNFDGFAKSLGEFNGLPRRLKVTNVEPEVLLSNVGSTGSFEDLPDRVEEAWRLRSGN